MKTIVVGGGPAGMLAAISASQNGDKVTWKKVINYRKR